MKLLLFILAGFASIALATAPSKLLPLDQNYIQSELVEKDCDRRNRVEVIYLPNNVCHISMPLETLSSNYRDYVRACLNNHHLRTKIDN